MTPESEKRIAKSVKLGFLAIRYSLSALLVAVGAWAEAPVPYNSATLVGGTTDLTLVDPDLSKTPLPKLVLPPEPPPSVRLPEVIVKADEWRGVQCGVTQARFAIFRHADKWISFWQRGLAPYSPKLAQIPKINFDKDMVVGIFMGEKPYPHYEIEIRSIRIENRPAEGRVLAVRYRDIKKMMGVFVPPFAVQPFHLKKVPAFEGEVVFLKVRR
jgi:hypothetical protein